MKRDTAVWLSLIAMGVLLLAAKAMLFGGYGKAYVRETMRTMVQIERPLPEVAGLAAEAETMWVREGSSEESQPGVVRTTAEPVSWVVRDHALPADFMRGEQGVAWSLSRTIGLWIAALLTLGLFSFMYGDNPLYRFAEAVFIGVSAAYWMVVAFWNVLVPNLMGKLAPNLVQQWAMPGLEATDPEWIYLVPLVLGVMLLWRLMPVGGWIARWPLALFIGVFAGLRMIQFIQADFRNQIANGILPLLVWRGDDFDWTQSLANTVSVLGVLACLTYFFFSIEHRGVVGKVARVGTWVLMITFGAMFGYTVMGRIVLLTGRLEFLFIDWLWLIDPAGTRLAGGTP